MSHAVIALALALAVPPGHHRERCPQLRVGAPAQTASIVLPDRFASGQKGDFGCNFSAPKDESVSVTIAPRTTLARYKRKEVDPFVGDEGDDGVRDVRYRGGRLDYYAYNDGSPIDVRIVQTERWRVEWEVKHGTRPAGFAAALESVRAAPAGTDACVAIRQDRSVRFTTPAGQTLGDSTANGCNLYLAGGYPSNYLEITPAADDEGKPAREDSERQVQDPSTQAMVDVHVAVVRRDGARFTWYAPIADWPAASTAFDTFLSSVTVKTG